MPGVSVLAVHQLTPELAEPLAAARLALFVDARLAVEGEAARVRPLEPVDPRATLGHASDPRALLALARAVYGHCPRAWSITVPATDLSLGERLSPTAERGMEDALREIGILVGREAEGRAMHEVGVMQSALEIALEQAGRQGASRIDCIALRVGIALGRGPRGARVRLRRGRAGDDRRGGAARRGTRADPLRLRGLRGRIPGG